MNPRRRQLLFAALFLAIPVACAADPSTSDEAAIQALLVAQAAAWNRGDLDAFMAGYWQDERLRFASGGRVTRGWQTTLDGYRSRYPDHATMGVLVFSELEIEMTGPDAALAFGRWSLDRVKNGKPDRPSGLFTLLLRRTADGWRITRDHTSSAD